MVEGLQFAYRPLRANASGARAWRPAQLPSGKLAVYHGYFDNAPAVAAELDTSATNLSRLYGLAVERWGEAADRHIIGEYCALVADPETRALRLARSPIRAPPLFYYRDETKVAAASVPRAIFAAGVEQRLNERRVADSAVFNFSDDEASWFVNVARVPLGSIVELRHGLERGLHRWYDVMALPDVRMGSAQDYVTRAGELLDEAVNACLTGFARPGATLSGGLDSPQVAVRAMRALPAGQRLPTFTFHPEPGFDGLVQAGMMADERPFVEALAAMHPRLDPHFTANDGYAHDHRWNSFFHLMGGAPPGLCNMFVFHGLFAEAARAGCDVLLVADWGNSTFSEKGASAFVEYFVKGRWRQLWLALRNIPNEERSMLWRFLSRCIAPALPNRAWRRLRQLLSRKESLSALMQPLSPEYRVASGTQERLERTGFLPDRHQPLNRRHQRKLLFENEDYEGGDMYQAFEQMYGVAQRDPTAYRPFVEFCLGLPTEVFMRDGETRWLAKELGKGIMPEAQRTNGLVGRWGADWHLRIGRRRDEIIADLDRLSSDQRLGRILDIPRMRASLEDWPAATETNPQKSVTPEMAVPRALLTARFIQYVEGRNDPSAR